MELEARNMAYTTLTADINDAVTTIPVTSAAMFPSTKAFIITINNERILVDSITGTDLNVNAAGRGYDDSSAAAHSNGDTVSIKVVAGYINWVNDAVTDKYDKTGGSITGDVSVDGGGAASGDLHVANDLTVSGYAQQLELRDYTETMPTDTSGSGTVTLDVNEGNVRKHTMTGNITIAFTNPGISGVSVSITLILKMHSSASTITWPASVTFNEDVAPDAPDPNKVAVFTFFTINNGTRWYGSVMANHMTE